MTSLMYAKFFLIYYCYHADELHLIYFISFLKIIRGTFVKINLMTDIKQNPFVCIKIIHYCTSR